MDERITVRLLVLNDCGELLLMHVKDRSVSDTKVDKSGGFWITLGGRLDPGESIEEAALREAKEETGQIVRLGPKVWYGEQILSVKGTPTLFKETFIVAYLNSTSLSRSGWTAEEQEVVKDLRWWRIDELEKTTEVIFPASMKGLIAPITRGKFPKQTKIIEL